MLQKFRLEMILANQPCRLQPGIQRPENVQVKVIPHVKQICWMHVRCPGSRLEYFGLRLRSPQSTST